MPAPAENVHVYVTLQRDADGYPPYEAEELDGVGLEDPSAVRITATPAFVRGLAHGDVVRVRRDTEGLLWVTEVLEEGDHACARIITFGDTDEQLVLREFTDLGCLAQATPFGLLTVDIPPTADGAAVVEALRRGRATGAWDYDLGVSPAG